MGLGYTYADLATATLIDDTLKPLALNSNVLAPAAAYMATWRGVRNLGRPGICSMAISAVDCALWDLKAKLLDLPLVAVTWPGSRRCRRFTEAADLLPYTHQQLAAQLSGWVNEGIPRVKMKVGRDAHEDVHRVRVARDAIGQSTELFVDANGAYTRKQSLAQAGRFGDFGVTWFEEPVSSDDLDGLRLIRDRSPEGMNIAAGEYGYDIFYFRSMLAAGAVDVQQADVTRCGGFTALLQVAALCQAHSIPLSCHTAPALHTHAACAMPAFLNLEYFHDHVRIERMFFDGFPKLAEGELRPDLSRPGIGLELKRADAKKYAA